MKKLAATENEKQWRKEVARCLEAKPSKRQTKPLGQTIVERRGQRSTQQAHTYINAPPLRTLRVGRLRICQDYTPKGKNKSQPKYTLTAHRTKRNGPGQTMLGLLAAALGAGGNMSENKSLVCALDMTKRRTTVTHQATNRFFPPVVIFFVLGVALLVFFLQWFSFDVRKACKARG